MSQEVLATIAKANRRIEAVRRTNDQFLENARANAVPRDVPTSLDFDELGIAVEIFGYKARSVPRVVRVDEDYYMEYLFSVEFDGEESYEVTRFYVTASGLVYEDLESEVRICDYNNEYIASHICSRVAIGILKSPLFAVTKQG